MASLCAGTLACRHDRQRYRHERRHDRRHYRTAIDDARLRTAGQLMPLLAAGAVAATEG